MIEIRNLKKEYPGVTPLEDVSVTIRDGDVIAVIGPSGTGKSTLIRCINLLEKPTAGQILVDGEDITAKGYDIRKARRKIGMVFQSYNLFEHLTVIENLMIPPMDLLHRSRQEAYDRGMVLLKQVGLADKALSYPDELSGGQKQRAAIARTLCMDPEVILMDEPTSALDPAMIAEVQAVIQDLSVSGKTMLIVTHEMNFARAVSNHVFYMDRGGIYEDGTPEEIFDHPKQELTRRFIRGANVFEAVIDSRDYDFISFGARLDRYLMQNQVQPKNKYRIRLALEELVQQILMPRYENPFLRISAKYSSPEETCRIDVRYRGDRFDIRETDNELSLSVLMKIAREIEYSYQKDSEEPNHAGVLLSF